MINKLRAPFKGLIDLIAKPFTIFHPNLLSFFSTILAIPGFYFYAQGNSLLGSLFIFGAMFDMIDGAVARLTGKTSKFGGILDATLDRLFEGILFLVIGIGGIVSWEVVTILLTVSLCVSYIKAKAEATVKPTSVGTNDFSVGIAERGDRLFMITAASILNHFFTKDGNQIMEYAFILLIIFSIITLVWRAVVIYKVVSKEV